MTTNAIIEAAFKRGVRGIKNDVQTALLLDALRDGDVQRALEAIDIEPAAFEDLRNSLVQTYADAGAEATKGLRGVRWNGASPRAEEYARNRIGTEIQRITDDSLTAVRNHIADGYAFGRSPNRIALDLVGRIGPSGRREGGVVGLSAQQEGWTRNMRDALETDPSKALRFTRRDRRFDSLLRSGNTLSQAQIDRILTSYTNRLELSRGRMIAVTERGAAINQGRIDAYKNAADKYGVDYSAIVKEWVYTGRSRVDRQSHASANGVKVQGIDTPFNIGGVALQYPHDPNAAAEDVINCNCVVKIRIPGIG